VNIVTRDYGRGIPSQSKPALIALAFHELEIQGNSLVSFGWVQGRQDNSPVASTVHFDVAKRTAAAAGTV
jgi:hypothetical protein